MTRNRYGSAWTANRFHDMREAELIANRRRINPLSAPINRARPKELLLERVYRVGEGSSGPRNADSDRLPPRNCESARPA